MDKGLHWADHWITGTFIVMSETTQSDNRSVLTEWLERDLWWRIYLLGWLPVGLAYLAILGLFAGISGLTLIATWLSNIIFPSIAGLGVAWVIVNIYVRLKPVTQLVLHMVGAVAFSTLWSMVIFRLLQVTRGLLTGNWVETRWQDAVLAWQLFQGLAIYLVIASATYAYWALRELNNRALDESEATASQRIYAKTSDGLMPLREDEISLARAIDGLTFLFVDKKKLDSRMTLSELETALPSESFLRVHRSAIVNLNHILSIESAGNGRKTIHLKNSVSLETSRAGAAALKARLALV